MKLILDTHTYLWLRSAPKKVSPSAASAIADSGNQLFVSIVSMWEVAIKVAKGTLQVDAGGTSFLIQELGLYGIELLSISAAHLSILENLPRFHKDPFDRLLVSQAIAEDMTLVTIDNKLSEYPVRTLWR